MYMSGTWKWLIHEGKVLSVVLTQIDFCSV